MQSAMLPALAPRQHQGAHALNTTVRPRKAAVSFVCPMFLIKRCLSLRAQIERRANEATTAFIKLYPGSKS
jgi:hypothetical protein